MTDSKKIGKIMIAGGTSGIMIGALLAPPGHEYDEWERNAGLGVVAAATAYHATRRRPGGVKREAEEDLRKTEWLRRLEEQQKKEKERERGE